MTRGRVESRTLTCDHNGVNIKAVLRRQRVGVRNWQVRWQENNGKWDERSTKTNELLEAEVRGREIIRGEGNSSPQFTKQGMPIASFVVIQKNYHARNARPEAGESTLDEFMGVWDSFLRVWKPKPHAKIQDVTEKVAIDYLERLKVMSKTENRQCTKKSPDKLSVETIKKHIRTLAAAWNLVREGHYQRVGGLEVHQLAKFNPWQAIRNNIPQTRLKDKDPVQFQLEDNDLEMFLNQFEKHPVGELFIIVSLWCWGRITEMTYMEWSWFEDEYVIFPEKMCKGGRGKVAKLSPEILDRLKKIRDKNSTFVFAKWFEDVRANARRPTRVQPFKPGPPMVRQMGLTIKNFANLIKRSKFSHHMLRRTSMELGELGELRQTEKTSADKLQTTVGNKRKNYTKRLGRKAYALADGHYANITTALHEFQNEFPKLDKLVKRLGCEPLETLTDQEAEALEKKLTPIQRQRWGKRFLDGEASGEGRGVA
ncbi:MAG: hypothetical protein WCL90_13530 [Planctomycetota bacterium]